MQPVVPFFLLDIDSFGWTAEKFKMGAQISAKLNHKASADNSTGGGEIQSFIFTWFHSVTR